MTNSDLIMEMTGESRDTQVQPPIPVWVRYFRIDLESPLPTLTLTDGRGDNPVIDRPVAGHHHNWTVDIPRSNRPRPAIIRLLRAGPRRTGRRSYTYGTLGQADPQYGRYRHLLDTVRSPHRRSGRLWLIVEPDDAPDAPLVSAPVLEFGQGFGPADGEVERAAVG